MSTSPDGPAAAARLPLPSAWPVWVVPAFVALVQVVGSFGAQDGPSHGGGPPWAQRTSGPDPFAHSADLDALGVGLLLAGPALLLLRRRHPVAVLAGAGAVTMLYLLRAYTYGPVFLSLVVAMFAAVTAGHRLVAWAGTFLGSSAYLALTSVVGVDPERRGRTGELFPVERPDLGMAAYAGGWALAVLVSAELVRMRRQRAAAAERVRAEERRRQASEERLRMARELHDVLGHNISMINVRAGVALHLLDDDPAQAREALAAIKEASKEALTEMRSMIGALRAPDEEGRAAPRAPAAGLDRLDDLLDRARAAGLRVEAEVAGERRPLPAGADLAAFRIVQESLTNVARHAGPGPVTARVRIAYGEHEVHVRVDDDGRGASPPDERPAGEHGSDGHGGSGLRGMRERAVALGGTFEAGPRAGGGFRVRAVLPTDRRAEEAK
ncbi:sensor histidine kinase [Actinomadura kijaniata]|uniref:sensor histidine kinase n=1 Tax=Actinomadura kijaniata TaxID=46161 RepID=UPI003F1BAD82